jgi:signal transduction histidine kinase
MVEDMTDSEYFTALLSHDISNYNQTIRGYLEMLLNEQMGPVTAEQSRALGRCLKQSRRIQSLIESVRLFRELDETEVQLRELNLDSAIKEALEVVQNDFADREIRARFTAAARATRAEPQLTAVFVHLFNNAVKFNTCDLVEIDVQVTRVDDQWEIRIIDNGSGVPAARRDSLFDRYVSHDIHGSGMGLSVVREMVQRWGGEIRLEPPAADADGGAAFTLNLPAV